MVKLSDYYLRALEENDLSWLKSLRNDESTWSQLGHFVFLNNEKQKKWFDSLNTRSDAQYLVFGKGDQALGIVRLTEIDWGNRSICVGGDMIVEHRGQGHARNMYELIFKLCFEVWNMHRVWLLVLKTNEHAYNLYKKMGFKDEGAQREAIFKKGKYIDYLMMSILENEYAEKNK